MPRRRRPEALLLLLLAACGDAPAPVPAPPPAPTLRYAEGQGPGPTAPAPPRDESSEVLSDQWYRTLRDGQPSGWRHVRWTRSTFEGRETVRDVTEGYSVSTRNMSGVSDRFESRERSECERTPEGMLLRMEVRVEQGERASVSTQTWTGSGYELVSRVAGLEERHRVECDAPCPVDAEAFLSLRVRRGEVRVGDVFRHATPNFLGERLDAVTLRVESREPAPGAGGDCLRVVETVEGAPGSATWWIDAAGVVRRLVSSGSEVVAATESEARDLSAAGATYSITVDAEPEMARCTSLDRAVVEVVLEPREGIEMPDFPPTPFSREVGRAGNAVRVELSAHDEAPLPVEPPVRDPAFARWLERTNLFCADDPLVQAALARARGDARDGAEIVRRILRHVFLTLEKGSGPVPQPTAREILEAQAGDCSEHCVLFVTLCRAAGIPARRYSGYAQVGDAWGAHSFAEVWLGRWVGADPTTNELGTKARYLCFGLDDDADSFPGEVSARVTGRMRVRTLEFAEGGRTWKVSEIGDAPGLDDPLSGLALAVPEGWTASIGPSGHAAFSGPGVRGEATVHAGMGDLPCDVLRTWIPGGTDPVKFGGLEALREDLSVRGRPRVRLLVPWKRRLLDVFVRVEDPANVPAALAGVERLLAPTLR